MDNLVFLLLHRPDALVEPEEVAEAFDKLESSGKVRHFGVSNQNPIQPWSPFQYGFFEGVFLGNDKFPELNKEIDRIADKYGVSNTTIAIAWILRHPANMMPMIGTMSVERMRDCVKASEISLTREEWYEIYRAAGNILP